MVLPTCKTIIALIATTFTLFVATTKMAACDCLHKRGGAAFGRVTCFVVAFVVAMNRVDVVALNTILVLRVSTAERTVGRNDSRLDGWLVGRTPLKN